MSSAVNVTSELLPTVTPSSMIRRNNSGCATVRSASSTSVTTSAEIANRYRPAYRTIRLDRPPGQALVDDLLVPAERAHHHVIALHHTGTPT